MENKDRIKLLMFNNDTWKTMKSNRTEIAEYLSDGKMASNMHNLLVDSVKLVLSELMLNKEAYCKYPAKNYTDEDFVKCMVKELAVEVPDLKNYEGNVKYVDDFRKLLWEHIKKYDDKMHNLIANIVNPDAFYVLKDEDMMILSECSAVVFVECVLREREAQLLEHGD